MKNTYLRAFYGLLCFFPFVLNAQTEGYSNQCGTTAPSITEVMIDACGDEFRSEYVILTAQNQPFDVRLYGMECRNPLTNAYIGSTSIDNNSVNHTALSALNAATSRFCPYGTVFKDIFAPPYNGILPPHAVLLVFNNRDSTDVGFLSPQSLSALCGSTVFVAFATLRSQSPGQSIFRNYPPNGRCSSGCIRTIAFRFEGANSPFCTFLNYDYSKLPHLNTTNPPEGFGEGSYIRPDTVRGTIVYGGGNLSGTGVCMPPLSMRCVVPHLPSLDTVFWRISVFDGLNTLDSTDFKGYYQAYNRQITRTTEGWDIATDGWPLENTPHLALEALGAARTYQGCNLRPDSFSLLGEKKGWSCGYYALKLTAFDTFTRVRLDPEGDGVWTTVFLQNSTPLPPDSVIWRGYLGPASQATLFTTNIVGRAQLSVHFIRDTNSQHVLQSRLQAQRAACGHAATGRLDVAVTGGQPPYDYRWAHSGLSNTIADNLSAGSYPLTVTDRVGCTVQQVYNIIQITDFQLIKPRDTILCRPDTLLLRGYALGGWGHYHYQWAGQPADSFLRIGATETRFWPLVVRDSSGCELQDSVKIIVADTTVLQVDILPSHRVCQGQLVRLRATPYLSDYSWQSQSFLPLNSRSDTLSLTTADKPPGVYHIAVQARDSLACWRTTTTTLSIDSLPIVYWAMDSDTVCIETPYLPLVASPDNGQFRGVNCLNCVENNVFIPERAGIGRFELQYEVANGEGCTQTATRFLTVKQCICPNPPTARASLPRAVCDAPTLRLSGQIAHSPESQWQTLGGGSFDNISVLDPIYMPDSTDRQAGRVCMVLTALDPDGSGVCEADMDTACTVLSTAYRRMTFSEICAGDTLVWHGRQLTESGQYDTLYTSQWGCDSLERLQLKVKRKDLHTDSARICKGQSQLWQGQNRTETGLYTARFVNTEGCDSLEQLALTVLPVDTTYQWRTSCNRAVLGLQKQLKINQFGCDSVVFIQTVFTPSDMRLELQPRRPILCFGDKTASFEAKIRSGGQPPFDFKWEDGGTTPLIEGLGAGPQQLRVVDAQGCQVDTLLWVAEPAPLAMTAVGLSPPCEGLETGSIRVDGFRGGTPPYEVTVSNQVFNIPTWPFFLHFLRVGTYDVVLKDRNGCAVHQAIDIAPAPHRVITLPDVIDLTLGDTVMLRPQMPFIPQTVRWQPHWGLSCDTCLYPLARPFETENYTLHIVDTQGCVYTARTRLVVDKTTHWFIPTVFSPNNDGENDVFRVFTDDKIVDIPSMRVFDRWGNLLFEQYHLMPNQMNSGWDGTKQGQPLPEGVYVFQLVLKLLNGRDINVAGDVFLKR